MQKRLPPKAWLIPSGRSPGLEKLKMKEGAGGLRQIVETIDVIGAHASADVVAIVGHEPHLSMLVTGLM